MKTHTHVYLGQTGGVTYYYRKYYTIKKSESNDYRFAFKLKLNIYKLRLKHNSEWDIQHLLSGYSIPTMIYLHEMKITSHSTCSVHKTDNTKITLPFMSILTCNYGSQFTVTTNIHYRVAYAFYVHKAVRKNS